MTTAVDTNVLIDIVSTSAEHRDASNHRLRAARLDGAVLISETVFAELSPGFADREGAVQFLADLGISLHRSSPKALHLAGLAFHAYLRQRERQRCAHCGETVEGRQHILPDFMIGAHAQVHAGRLLTRDRGFYAKYFPGLGLV